MSSHGLYVVQVSVLVYRPLLDQVAETLLFNKKISLCIDVNTLVKFLAEGTPWLCKFRCL